ncbi:MAG: ATP-binding protein [Deltaproteobacteria bacterium]|nr:ATP-binding protein [Deltaproteobacteria bacterium]
MENDLPLLPVGTSIFKKIRDDGKAYVDKTQYLPELKKYGEVIFLSRPRRFGKSLTVSTLDSFYSGEKKLFEGLAIQEYMNSPGFASKPVIRLDMSAPSWAVSKEKLEAKIIKELKKSAKRHNVSLQEGDSADIFLSLIEDIQASYSQKVVLLIDEYDAPVIKTIQDPVLSKIKNLIEDTRSIMSNFYSKVKSADEYLDFVFITGVTKFSRMGVFSTLNNLTDISLLPEFASFIGFTHEELELNFKPFIKRTADRLCLKETELLDKIKAYYDGFSFDGETKLYNPFSTMNFFVNMKFNNYWMESGSNTLIRKMLKDKGLTAQQFENCQVNMDFIRFPGEIDAVPPEGFLYQAGYLTLRKDAESSFRLDYPNFEVLSSMSRLYMDNLFPSIVEAGKAAIELEQHVKDGDIPAIVDDIVVLYSTIAYDDHAAAKCLSMYMAIPRDKQAEVKRLMEPAWGKAAIVKEIYKMSEAFDKNKFEEAYSIMNSLIEKSGLANEIILKLSESFYRAILHSFLLGAGLKAYSEIHSSKGRCDLVVDHKEKIYVIETKVVEKASLAEAAAKNGIKQIMDIGYAKPYKNPILVSLAVAQDLRNVAACCFIKEGKTENINFKHHFLLERTTAS